MKTVTVTAALATAVLALTPSLAHGTPDAVSNQYKGGITHRINGADRVATNYQLIKAKYGDKPVHHAYIARADLGADALSAAPLATKDPIVLINTRQPAIDTINNQIGSLGIKEVTVIGGNAAIPQSYVDSLGVKTRERLAGKDRYETNLAVIRKAFPTPQTVFVVNGDGMVDTIAATATAMTQYGPLMLASSKGYTANQEAYVESNPNCTVTSIGNAPAYPTRQHRISQLGYAQTPEQISALVAKQTYPSGNDRIYLANSTQLADAISAGIIKDGPVLLVNPAKHPTEALQAAADLNTTHVFALGGEQAISQQLLGLFGIKTTSEKPQPKPKPGETKKPGQSKPSGQLDADGASSDPTELISNSLDARHIFKDMSLSTSKVPGWENLDRWTELLVRRMKAGWGGSRRNDGEKNHNIPYDEKAPIYDSALNHAAETNEGVAGTVMLCPVASKGNGGGVPAWVFDINHEGLILCKGQPGTYGLLAGDKVETATGIYTIDKVTFGVHLRDVFNAGEKILLNPIYVIKYYGHTTDGETQEIDESGITATYRYLPEPYEPKWLYKKVDDTDPDGGRYVN